MTDVKTAHRIGEPVFVVQSDGNIVRSAIKSLRKDEYRLFSNDGGQRFFDFDEAVTAVEATVRRLIDGGDVTRKTEKTLREFLDRLRTPLFREEISAQMLVQSSQGLFPERSLGGEVAFPTDYFLPEQKVFGIVTPASHNGLSDGWRPRPYFVLSTTVEEVSFAENWPGKVYYGFSTHYHFAHDRIFADPEAAREAMMAIFTEETCGTILSADIPFFSSADEEVYMKQLFRVIAGSH